MTDKKPPLPKVLKIGPYTYHVVTDPAKYNAYRIDQENGSDCIGNTDTESLTIYLQHGMPQELMAETLHHEVMHAVYFNSAFEHMKDVSEEVLVSLLSLGMLTVYKDNPKLMEFLLWKGK